MLDPSIASATGTPESGGWTTRELKRYIEGVEGMSLVGADVAEVSPPYDSIAETTSVAAADLIIDILAAMAKNSPDFKIGVGCFQRRAVIHYRKRVFTLCKMT